MVMCRRKFNSFPCSIWLGVVCVYLRPFHRILIAGIDLPGICWVKVGSSVFHGIGLRRCGPTMLGKIWSCLSDQACATRGPDFSTLLARTPTPPFAGHPRASRTPPVPEHPRASKVDVAKARCFWYAESKLRNNMTPHFQQPAKHEYVCTRVG